MLPDNIEQFKQFIDIFGIEGIQVDSGTLAFSAAEFKVIEDGTSVAAVTVTRSGVFEGEPSATISLSNGTATAAEDYSNTAVEVKFAPGETQKTVFIPIVDDALVEGNETINLTLGAPKNGATIGESNTAIFTIVDNESNPDAGKLLFNAAEFSVIEDGTPILPVTVTRVDGSVGEVRATVSLSDGTAIGSQDYNNTSVEVSFAEGETEKVVGIPILDDNLPEGNESVILTLSNPKGGAAIGDLNRAIFTIINDEVPGTLAFANTEFSVLEADIPMLAVTVIRTDGSFGEVSATINLTDITGTASADYVNTPIAVNFADGETEKTVAIPILDDGLREGIETVNLSLANPTGGATIGAPNTATLKIVDNEASSIISSTPGTLVSAETIDVFLAPGEELTIPITVTVPDESSTPASRLALTSPAPAKRTPLAASAALPRSLPLDVFLLQDASDSFSDDVSTFRGLVPNLVDTLLKQQPDTQFGLGSFVDKPIEGIGSFADDHYVYRTNLPLTTDADALQSAVNNLTTRPPNEEQPEAQLEALLQVARRANTPEISFQSGARRVVVVATDAPFYQDGDGRIVAGITTPNNGDAVLDGNPPGTGEDYPSIQQVRQALIEANILPVFAVTSDQIGTYQELVERQFGFGAVTQLETNSSNLVGAITQGLESLGNQINIFALKDDAGFIKGISQDRFLGVLPGESRTFNVTLRSDGTPINSTVDLRALGYGDTKINVITKLEGPYAGIPATANTSPATDSIPKYLTENNWGLKNYYGEVTGGVTQGTLLQDVSPDKRRIVLKEVNSPANPQQTWVIIHGWNDSSENNLKRVAEAIKDKRPSDRILLLDWREASNNEDSGALGLAKGGNGDAATWIGPVAEFTVKKLQEVYNIDGKKALESLNLVGHSLGSLVSSEIGNIYKTGKNRKQQEIPGITSNKEVKQDPTGKVVEEVGGVRTITALDPPSESNVFLVGGYDLDGSNPGKDEFKGFTATSKFSRAFVGSGSWAGNQDFAGTANESFQIDFGDRVFRSGPDWQGTEHGWVVQSFANLINDPDKIGSLLGIRAYDSINDLPINNFGTLKIRDNRHEGILFVQDPKSPDDKTDNFSSLKPSLLIARSKNNQDNDIVIGSSASEKIDGASSSDENLEAAVGGDIRYTGFGDDLFFGEGGNDELVGDSGNDTLIGGSGEDKIEGDWGLYSTGDDIISGGDGKDKLTGGSGKDTIYGDDGDDLINGQQDNDLIAGGKGTDYIYGDKGDDKIDGDDDNDTLEGNDGSDTLIGSKNNDTLWGGGGDWADLLDGGSEDDLLMGEGGDDTLIGGTGKDTLKGGYGSDKFVFSPDDVVSNQDAADTIDDFGTGSLLGGGVDKIVLAGDLTKGMIEVEVFGGNFLGIGKRTALKAKGGYLAILNDDWSKDKLMPYIEDSFQLPDNLTVADNLTSPTIV